MPKRNDKKTPNQKLDELQKLIEKVGKSFKESMDERRKELTKGNLITITRMETMHVDKDTPGECDNIGEDELKAGKQRERVHAGDYMCSVGIIRKGRNWGDYHGVFCGECPYFIMPKKTEGKDVSKAFWKEWLDTHPLGRKILIFKLIGETALSNSLRFKDNREKLLVATTLNSYFEDLLEAVRERENDVTTKKVKK